MAQTITDYAGIGATLNAGVWEIDFTNPGRTTDGIQTPANITPAQAIDVLLSKLATLTAAVNDPTAAIAAPTTQQEPQYIASRGGTAVSQMRRSITIYLFYESTDSTTDPDNLIA